MTTQSAVSAESLSLVAHNNVPVVTTDMLAQLYGAEIKNIQNNFARNQGRFVEGKHFFKIEGEAFKAFRLQPSLSGLQISPKARHLILWTERGAARHAKMLDTDQAWEVFEKLEDCYFTKKPTDKLALTDGQHFIVAKDGVVIYHKPLSKRTSHRYLQPRITQSPECTRALSLLSSLQALPKAFTNEAEYWAVRKALSLLIDRLYQYQPYAQVEPAVDLLRAVEKMMVHMWTMIDESKFKVEMVNHAAERNACLSQDRIQTIKNIKHILGLPLTVRLAY